MQVLGLGPMFRLSVGLTNTSLNNPSRNLIISFYADDNIYKVTIVKIFFITFIYPSYLAAHLKHLKVDGTVSQRCISKFKIEVRICIPAIR